MGQDYSTEGDAMSFLKRLWRYFSKLHDATLNNSIPSYAITRPHDALLNLYRDLRVLLDISIQSDDPTIYKVER
jgi:hypothetical protein